MSLDLKDEGRREEGYSGNGKYAQIGKLENMRGIRKTLRISEQL